MFYVKHTDVANHIVTNSYWKGNLNAHVYEHERRTCILTRRVYDKIPFEFKKTMPFIIFFGNAQYSFGPISKYSPMSHRPAQCSYTIRFRFKPHVNTFQQYVSIGYKYWKKDVFFFSFQMFDFKQYLINWW